MSRIPSREPKVDCIAAATVNDPELSRVRWLQTADDRAWALFTAWGGAGIWVPLWMLTASYTRELQLRVAPAFQHVRIDYLVNGAGTIAAASTATGFSKSVSWDNVGTTPDFRVSLSGGTADANGPLQVRSGVAYTWTTDKITFSTTAVGGKSGIVYGALITPLYNDAF